MHKLIEKYLFKKGIEKPEDLSLEEKKVFDGWQSVLGKEELTMDDLKNFMNGQVTAIENRWKDLLVSKKSKSELIPYHTVYKILLSVMDAPKSMKEALEVQLNQLINQ